MPSDANRSSVTLTTFHAWNGRKWVEQPAPPVTVTEGPEWVREPLQPTADPILDAYARYDSDPRVNGPDDFEAFRDAILPLTWFGISPCARGINMPILPCERCCGSYSRCPAGLPNE